MTKPSRRGRHRHEAGRTHVSLYCPDSSGDLGYARYVGRVGALAVALGVGLAVANTPGVAWAQDGASDAPTPAGPSQDTGLSADDAADKDGADGTDGAEGVGGGKKPTTTTDNQGSQSTTTVGVEGSPQVTISATTVDTTPDDPGGGTIKGQPGTEPLELTGTDTGPVLKPPAAADALTPPTDSGPDGTVRSSGDPVAAAAAALTKPITEFAYALDAFARSFGAPTAKPTPPAALTAPVAPQPEPAAFSAKAAALAPAETTAASGLAGVFTQLVSAVLAPFAGAGPTSPAPLPVLWAVLAWVRREIDTAITKFATPPVDETLTSQAVAPMALARAAAPTTMAAVAAPTTMAAAAAPPPPPPPPPGLLSTVGFIVNGVGNIVGGLLGGLLGGLVNQPPTAAPTIGNPDAITGAVTGNLNARDPNNDAMTYAVTTAPPTTRATVTVTTAGVFTYTPTAAARAAALASPGPDVDQFTITITDARGARTTVNVNNVPIAPANRAPVSNGSPTVFAPDPVTGVVTGNLNVTDPDGHQLTYTSTTPSKGTVSVAANGTFTYKPSGQAQLDAFATSGPDTDAFAVTVTDGHGGQLTVPVNNVTVAPAQRAIIASIGVGDGPTQVAINPTGTRAYVTNANAGTLSIIDTTTNAVIATVAVGSGADGVQVNPAGTRVYVASTANDTVKVINAANNTVVATVGVGDQPSGLVIHPDGSRIYVANKGSGTLSVIDAASNQVVTIPVGGAPQDLAISTDGFVVWATDSGTGTVTLIDTNSNEAFLEIPAGQGARGVAVDENYYSYIANRGNGTVSVVFNDVEATIPVGANPTGVTVNSSGTRIYVTNAGSNSISIIDIDPYGNPSTYRTVIDTVPVGSTPLDVAVTSNGSRAYVTNYGDDTVSVVGFANRAPAAYAPPISSSPSASTGAVYGNFNVADPDGDLLTYTVGGAPASGTVDLYGNGFTYTPSVDARLHAATTPGPDVDSFTVTVSDGRGGTTTVVSSVPIAANQAPIAGTPTVGDPDRSGMVVGALNVSDPDGDALTYTLNSASAKGDITIESDGSFTYRPTELARQAAAAGGAAASDTFSVVVADTGGASVTQTVTVHVAPYPPPGSSGEISFADGVVDVTIDQSTGNAYVTTQGPLNVDPSKERMTVTVLHADGTRQIVGTITGQRPASGALFDPHTGTVYLQGSTYNPSVGSTHYLNGFKPDGTTWKVQIPGGQPFLDPTSGTVHIISGHAHGSTHVVTTVNANGTVIASPTLPGIWWATPPEPNPVTGAMYYTAYNQEPNPSYPGGLKWTTTVNEIAPNGSVTVKTLPGSLSSPASIDPLTGAVYQTVVDYDPVESRPRISLHTFLPDGTTRETILPPGSSTVTGPTVDATTGTRILNGLRFDSQADNYATTVLYDLAADGSLTQIAVVPGAVHATAFTRAGGGEFVVIDVILANFTIRKTRVVAIAPDGTTTQVAEINGCLCRGQRPVVVNPVTHDVFVETGDYDPVTGVETRNLTIVHPDGTTRTIPLHGEIHGNASFGADLVANPVNGNVYEVTFANNGFVYVTVVKPDGTVAAFDLPANNGGPVVDPFTGIAYQAAGRDVILLDVAAANAISP